MITQNNDTKWANASIKETETSKNTESKTEIDIKEEKKISCRLKMRERATERASVFILSLAGTALMVQMQGNLEVVADRSANHGPNYAWGQRRSGFSCVHAARPANMQVRRGTLTALVWS